MSNPIFTNDYLYPIGILIAMVFALWFGKEKSLKVQITKLDVIVFAFFMYTAINTALYRLIPLNTSDFYFLTIYATIYVTSRHLNSTLSNPIKSIFYLIMLTAFFECIIGVYQFFTVSSSNHSAFKVTGSFVSPALFSSFLASVLPFSIYYYLNKAIRVEVRFASLTLAILIVINIILFTDSRASWMAALLIISVIIFLEKKTSFRFTKQQVYTLIAVCISVFIVLMIFKKDSTSGRWFILKNTLYLIKEHPIAGIGINNFDKYYNDYQASVFSSNSVSAYYLLASYVTVAYNDYLQFWLAGGIFALIILFVAIFAFLSLIKRVRDFTFTQKAAFISVTAISFLAFFSFPFQMSAVATNFTIFLAIISSLDTSRLYSFSINTMFSKYILIGFSLIIIFKMLITYNAIIRLEFVNSISSSKKSTAERTNALYNGLWPELHNNNDYLEAYGQAMYTKGNLAKASEILTYASKSSSKYDIYLMMGAVNEKMGKFKEAEKFYGKCNDLVPSFFTAKYRLMILYLKQNDIEEAKTLAQIILDSPIKVNAKMVNFIRAEAGKVLQKK